MQPTKYPEANVLISELQNGMRSVLQAHLIGTYLYGSLVWGDFDLRISDVDLLAIMACALDRQEFASLGQMHTKISDDNPRWRNRIEIAYVPLLAIQSFKTQTSNIAVISPGEPFHVKEAGRDWLINWYVVQEKGVTIHGPDPGSIIPHISEAEFIQGVKEQALEWKSYVEHTRGSRPYQGHAILTLCRALYAVTNGEQVSKNLAATWAKSKLPEWADTIDRAWSWRASVTSQDVNPEETYAETVEFVRAAADKVLAALRVQS